MQVINGLFNHCVLQRVKQNICDALIDGVCDTDGQVTATVSSAGQILKGLNDVRVGTAKKGAFSARLRGIPAGGPYDILLSVGAEAILVKDVCVGDVWLLGGQSNMQGVGLLKDSMKPNRLVRAFYMTDEWGIAKDPLHQLNLAVDNVHIRLRGGRQKPDPLTGVGPGLPFALEQFKRSKVPQGVIACAHGGTSMAQWDPKLKKLKGDSLYGAMIRRFVKNGGKVAGMIWYQGEGDRGPVTLRVYTAKMKALIGALRRDAKQPSLPVAIVQIGRYVIDPSPTALDWNSVQDQQRRLPKVIKNLATVPAIDLSLDDIIHISGRGHTVLGARLADAMQWLINGKTAGHPPIELESVSVSEPRPGFSEIKVKFSNVVGELKAHGRPVGFSLGSPLPTSGIVDTTVKGNVATMIAIKSVSAVKGMTLSYGAGFDPICNIVDGANRSLPVFGPLPLGKPRAVTPFVQNVWLSEFLPCPESLKSLKCPDMSKINATKRSFPAEFCNINPDVIKRGSANELVYFAYGIRCVEPMKLRFEIGYDGPVVVWIDGKRVFIDLKGTNPALPVDKGRVPYAASKGEHSVIVALSTNHGAAWGIYSRFERTDVSAKQVLKGAENYTMPELTL